MSDADWWRGAVIYQIYPRSFMDCSGDGVGDLPGITEKLDYVASLGVDALWISPFYPSPMKDFGYDVADYRGVDPLFGTLADFDRLLEAAHARDLKLVIDQVLSHTSDRHPWFRESRASRDNAKADWYVWADAKPDGTPPNNWLAVFGGPAWQWEPRRGQYYLHNFLPSQPDLNHRSRAMSRALMDEIAFWLERGVDGLRLDAVNFCIHDAELRDNPPRHPDTDPAPGAKPGNPYALQRHLYDKSQEENFDVLARIRSLTDRYPGVTTIGEVSDDDSLATAAAYTRGRDHLHMAYTFDLLTKEYSAARIRGVVERLESEIGDGWPCWAFSNHDVARVASRWHGGGDGAAQARMLVALLTSMRGSACLYQGEELGLPEADIPYERLRDPYGINFYPTYKGRDGCRTPMPWRAAVANAGFSEAEPWLPVPEAHSRHAVDAQTRDPGSTLNATRRFLAWRKLYPALRHAAIRFLDAPEPILAFERHARGEHLLAVFNLGPEPACYGHATPDAWRPLEGHGFPHAADGATVRLPGYGAFFAAEGA